MRVFSSIAEARSHCAGRFLAIGNFDGVHLGHQALLKRAASLGDAGLLTFTPHPAKLLAPEHAPMMIYTDAEKQQVLADYIDLMIAQPFDAVFASTSPADFIAQLSSLDIGGVVVGHDFRFGYKGRGDLTVLTSGLAAFGMQTEVVAAVRKGGVVCSSTAIRAAISAGRVDWAAVLLGRPYAITGKVVHGDARGRELGFPTANVDSSRELLPKNGVYQGRVGDKIAVVNIGTRPTFDDDGLARIEVHIIDYDGDLYGQVLTVTLDKMIREEMRFASLTALKEQISADISVATK